jgi:hypothetical protein
MLDKSNDDRTHFQGRTLLKLARMIATVNA